MGGGGDTVIDYRQPAITEASPKEEAESLMSAL